MSSSFESKSPGLAAALSVLLPGLGHIYLGQVGIGIAYLIAAIVGYAAFVFPGLFVLLISALHAYRTADRQNEELEAQARQSSTAQAVEEKQREVEKLKIEKNTIKSDSFVQRLEKLGKLHTHDILDREEYKERKKQAISELGRKKIDKDPEDFLLELTGLKDHVLDADDFHQIKQRVL